MKTNPDVSKSGLKMGASLIRTHYFNFKLLCFLQAFTFIPYLWDTGGPGVVFISYFSGGSLLQLALIKINDVQTLIINCEAYLLFCSGS